MAIDGTPPGHRASKVAIEVAQRFGSTLTLASVLPAGSSSSDPYLESLIPLGDEAKPLRVQVEEIEKEARSRGILTVQSVVLRGKVVEMLIAYVAEHPQDLIVVGSRGLSRGSRLIMGSVSSELVDRAPCPVLVVRPIAKRH
ncbi:MAG: universal stress protein [Thermoplasmata archaeon]|nr:universal stress protein [Thermoplasmata archaeon]